MNPFVAGSWVRGELFTGREELLTGILEGNRHAGWLLGMRRVGKTSVLKQLEWLTLHPPYDEMYLPVYWDMQGSHDVDGLKDSLFESIEDSEEVFERHAIKTESLAGEDVFRVLRGTMKATDRAGRRLLLLCDEAEELIQIAEADDVSLRKLRRLLLQGEMIRCVLAATKRLGDVLGGRSDNATSPFLHGFLPPLYLSHFTTETTRRLLSRGGFPPEVSEEILRRTGGHPYLTQLMSRRLYDGTPLEQVTEEMKADELVKAFFSVDFSYLTEAEKRVVLQAIRRGGISPSQIDSESGYSGDYLRTLLHSLEMTGYLRQEAGNYVVSNDFFHHWLRNEHLVQQPASTQASSAPSVHVLPEKLGEGFRLAQYSIQKTLGTGGMGTVYMALDTHLERSVAIKVIHMSMAPSSTLKARFVREARTMSALKHPGIVSVYEFNELGGTWYLAMELVEGTSLRDLLNAPLRPFPAVDVFRMGFEIASILAYAHGAGVIHRDIKPANIMISSGGAVKLLDFGLAKILDERAQDTDPGSEGLLTRSGQILGTVAYMSPEQARGAGVGPETDQFSLGVVLYEMAAGVRPFQGPTDYATLYRILFQNPQPLVELRPDLPVPATAVVERLLQKNPAERFSSMSSACEALRQTWEELAATAMP